MFRYQSVLGLFALIVVLGLSQFVMASLEVGETLGDFTLPLHDTSTDVSLYADYDDHIVFLDFFAYWCGPCKTASRELEIEIQQYYDALGGNPAGIPVTIMSINIDDSNPTATNEYIDECGLELVLDDYNRIVYNLFTTGGIPRFAIINGVAGANYDQWEIIHLQTGYSSSLIPQFKDVINGVIPEPCSLVLLGLGGLLIRKRK